MQVNNLSDPAESDKLKNRFYGEESAAVYCVPSSSAAPPDPTSGTADPASTLRALWRDRLFDRQTELLQKHVEFSQRQQTELCEAIKSAWTAKEAEVTLDRDILLKLLEQKAAESQQQTNTVLQKLNTTIGNQTGTIEIDTAIQPMKSELKAMQFQLNRLMERQILEAPTSVLAVADSRPTAAFDVSFYVQIRTELAEISSEIGNLIWTPKQKKKKAGEIKPPENFVPKPFVDNFDVDEDFVKAPGRVGAVATATSASAHRRNMVAPPVGKAAKKVVSNDLAATVKRQVGTREAGKLASFVRLSPEKPRAPPKAVSPLSGLNLVRKPQNMRFDMQTNTEETLGGLPKRNPRDYLSIDDLYIDVPLKNLGETKMAVLRSQKVVSPSLGLVAQPRTVVERDERMFKIAEEINDRKIVIVSPSPVPLNQMREKEESVFGSFSDGHSLGEVSISSGQISDANSVSYW
jgi:hypothetical protein